MSHERCPRIEHLPTTEPCPCCDGMGCYLQKLPLEQVRRTVCQSCNGTGEQPGVIETCDVCAEHAAIAQVEGIRLCGHCLDAHVDVERKAWRAA